MENGAYLMKTPADEKAYPAFFINRGVSQHIDCILQANELNAMGGVDNKLHYDYLFHTLRKRKRQRGAWAKKKDSELITAIAFHFKVNMRRAAVYAELMSAEDKEWLLTKEGK